MKLRFQDIPRFWFGVSERVGRAGYATSGFALMLLKYGAEAIAIRIYTSSLFLPWDFLNPMLRVRTDLLRPAPDWLGWAMLVWSLPFLWIAISMSVRRAADAGASPWLGLVVLIPIVNLIFMLVMCLVPSKQGRQWSPRTLPASDQNHARSAILGLCASLVVGAVMLVTSVYLFSSYGAALFLGTPLLMGATAAYIHNRPGRRSYASAVALGLVSVLLAGSALLLFALEGLICVAMAMPLLVPIGGLGGVIGKAIADSTRRSHYELTAALLVLPVLAGVESVVTDAREREVLTAIEIDAPPEVVWEHVVSFADISEPAAWYFRLGLAYPQRARIIGRGVGATRYCEFTTGTFVEPITAWERPRRLAFDVTDQPAPMFELSPYRHIHPPHLDGFLRSNRGEFLLVPLPGSRTRLEGRTWYEFDMFPQWYWTRWSDLFIHRIHERVLMHVERHAEQTQLQDSRKALFKQGRATATIATVARPLRRTVAAAGRAWQVHP